ncbi:MAG: hypothetical protein FWE32_09225 [Oscillospiraceae bacterium]|nr:hypothetical protein [Oscillospiraceae bacterium]
MNDTLYVMMIERGKAYNKVTKEVIIRHIEHIKSIDERGLLFVCGLLKGYPGVAGMVILKTESFEQAEEICKAEPLVAEGYAKYKLSTMQVGSRENNFLL